MASTSTNDIQPGQLCNNSQQLRLQSKEELTGKVMDVGMMKN